VATALNNTQQRYCSYVKAAFIRYFPRILTVHIRSSRFMLLPAPSLATRSLHPLCSHPASDFIPELTMHYREVWQAEWVGCSANKLHSVKPHLGYCSVTHLSRRDAVILRRLRIGHTCITHRYLLTGDNQPLCDECKCSLTVKHIPLECYNLTDIREKYFACSSLKELFENVDATTVIDFIKEVDFYHLASCIVSFVYLFFTLAIIALFLLNYLFI